MGILIILHGNSSNLQEVMVGWVECNFGQEAAFRKCGVSCLLLLTATGVDSCRIELDAQ